LAGEAADVTDLAEDQGGHHRADTADVAESGRVLGDDGADARLDGAEFGVEAFDVLGVVEGELLARLPDLVARPNPGAPGEPSRG
jgi:hypothetical protein